MKRRRLDSKSIYHEGIIMKTKFSNAELSAIIQFVKDVRELCDLDEDLAVEIGLSVERVSEILEISDSE